MLNAIKRLGGLVVADVKTVAREAWFARRQPTLFTLDGVVLELDWRVSPLVRASVWSWRDYEHRERRIIETTLRTDDTVLELGAGLGFITTIAARIARDVNAYEADPDMASAAAATIVRNGVRATVTHGALLRSPGSGTTPFYRSENFWESSLLPVHGWASVEIPVLDFAEACEGASYLIVDIEGGEVDLLAG